jgi:hypothetical protein
VRRFVPVFFPWRVCACCCLFGGSAHEESMSGRTGRAAWRWRRRAAETGLTWQRLHRTWRMGGFPPPPSYHAFAITPFTFLLVQPARLC